MLNTTKKNRENSGLYVIYCIDIFREILICKLPQLLPQGLCCHFALHLSLPTVPYADATQLGWKAVGCRSWVVILRKLWYSV